MKLQSATEKRIESIDVILDIGEFSYSYGTQMSVKDSVATITLILPLN